MLEFVNVSKIYPEIAALDDVSFEITEGEFVFLIGASGSGKTTIIKLIIRNEDVTSGNIFFYDTDVTKLKGQQITQLRREIGVVFQDFKLLPNKNLYENIAFVLEVSGKKKADIEETVPYVLKLIGLCDRATAFPHEISGGEQQKVAIARAIANNPKILIADEPTGNLDPKSSWEIIELLSKINEWGTTVIMATHGSNIVNTLGKRVIQLERGKIVSDNKKGVYPEVKIKLVPTKNIASEKQEEEKENKENLQVKTKQVKKAKKEEKTEPKNEPKIKEKEIEITFTTKPRVHKKGVQKRHGKDVVDIYELKLPSLLEKKLIQADLLTIAKLKKLSRAKLLKVKGLSSKDTAAIIEGLEKFPTV